MRDKPTLTENFACLISLLFADAVWYVTVVQNYSRDYDVKCDLDTCKTYPVVTDSERGEMLCGGCGLVLVQNIADLSRESQGYTTEEFMSQARTGPALSLTMHDKGLSTVIGNNVDSTGRALSGKTKLTFGRL